MANAVKTNAVRLLEHAGIEHILHEYDTNDGKIDAVSMAAKMWIAPP